MVPRSARGSLESGGIDGSRNLARIFPFGARVVGHVTGNEPLGEEIVRNRPGSVYAEPFRFRGFHTDASRGV